MLVNNRHSRVHRRANAILEMVMVLPLLLFLGLGMAEFGEYFYVSNLFASACRDAARAAIPAAAIKTDPATAATRTLAQGNIVFTASMMTMVNVMTGTTVTDVSTLAAGQGLQVTLTANYSHLPVAYRPFYNYTGKGIGNNKVIICKCTMVKE
jgi:Flp pilus assembly protein TadG